MLRFGSAIGFKPPYFYNRPLVERLYRAAMPSRWSSGAPTITWCRSRMATTYAERLGNAAPLQPIAGAGHAVHLEQPDAGLAQITPVLAA